MCSVSHVSPETVRPSGVPYRFLRREYFSVNQFTSRRHSTFSVAKHHISDHILHVMRDMEPLCEVRDVFTSLNVEIDNMDAKSQQPSCNQAQHNFSSDSHYDSLLKSSFYCPTNLCLNDLYFSMAMSLCDDPFTATMTATPAPSNFTRSTFRLRGCGCSGARVSNRLFRAGLFPAWRYLRRHR